MRNVELEDWVALHLLPGLGPILARRALDLHGHPGEVAWRLPASGWRAVRGIGGGTIGAILGARSGLARRVATEMRRCRRLGVRLLSTRDPDYPAALREMPDAPLLLYMRGSVRTPAVRVAVVGSRRATAYGRRVAAGLGAALAGRGVEVVSGGARGIDTCAHRGALEGGGRTTAVMGSGFLHPYPVENERLFDRIAAEGAVLTEFALEVAPLPENFPRRNRIISGLSAAVVVVEATRRSGSLSTAAHALDQGREVLAVPGPVSSDRSEGCHRLIQQGAKLVHEVADILEELSPMYGSALSAPPRRDDGQAPPALDGLSDDESAVLVLFDDPEPIHVDVLADHAPFGVARLQAALLGLEIRGAVEALPGGFYLCRVPAREP